MPPEQDTPGAGNVKRLCSWNYLSDAPQAEPQAAGFSSGLSDAPQADVADFSFQPVKFESAIFQYLHCEFRNFLVLLGYIVRHDKIER